MADKTYNGWKNYETWSAALWLNNDDSNRAKVVRYFEFCRERGIKPTYSNLLTAFGLKKLDISFYNSRISRDEITRMLQDDYREYCKYTPAPYKKRQKRRGNNDQNRRKAYKPRMLMADPADF